MADLGLGEVTGKWAGEVDVVVPRGQTLNSALGAGAGAGCARAVGGRGGSGQTRVGVGTGKGFGARLRAW